jgi:DNA-binding MarR family transcriptional regulator
MADAINFDDLGNCLCFNLRRISRNLTSFYAAELKQHHLLPTQTPILAALVSRPGANMAELSEWLGMDRTTLVRNLRPLERDGLVKARDRGRGHKVILEITAEGRQRLKSFKTDWQKTQQKVVRRLGNQRWAEILKDLGEAIKT